MKILILGGSKSGKSLLAQDVAAKQNNHDLLYYVATMKPYDNEDDARILRHVKERDGMGFITVEKPFEIGEILKTHDKKASFLIDSLTALLTNHMFNNNYDENAAEKISLDLDKIISDTENLVIVSDILNSDSAVYDEMTENFRKSLANLNRLCAKKCDVVLEVCSGNIIFHKGECCKNVLS